MPSRFGSRILRLGASTAVLLALLASTRSAAAQEKSPAAPPKQDPWTAVVAYQLDALVDPMREHGYHTHRDLRWGSLRADEEAAVGPLGLSSLKTYLVAAGCDHECADLNLTVYGPDGALVARDTEPDDVPVVEFTPPTTGSFRLVVTMARCSPLDSKPDGCRYGVRVFEKERRTGSVRSGRWQTAADRS